MKSFHTRDFPVAAFLLAKGHQIMTTTRFGNSVLFHFAPAAANDALGYFDNFPIPCRTYYAAIKELKSLIHGSRDLANNMENIKNGSNESRT